MMKAKVPSGIFATGPIAVMLVMIGLLASGARAAPPLELEAGDVAWSRLVYRAADRPQDLLVEVTLAEVAPAGLASLLQSGPGADLASDDKLLRMTARIEVARSGRTYRTDVWFSPAEAAPLQRRRDKIGRDGNRKVFSYLADGVHRLRLDPKNGAEAAQPPESWSEVREHDYPYGAAQTGCALVTDPNLLFFIASAGAVGEAPLSLCVFNKQVLHRVELSAADAGKLEASYLEIAGGVQTPLRREAGLRRIRIRSFPPEVDGIRPERFEFFEMGGEIAIDLDRDSGLPLRISGEIGRLGRVEFLLSEVTLRP